MRWGIVLHADKGDCVTVVFLTSGELGLKSLTREEAWKIRETEARAAGKILGVQDFVFLRCRDSQLADDSERAITALLARREQAEIIYLPHAQEWHPDHKAAVAIARQLKLSAEFRAYEIWTPLQQVDEALDITAAWERKLAAVRAHASQMSQWPYERAVAGLNQLSQRDVGKNGLRGGVCEGLVMNVPEL